MCKSFKGGIFGLMGKWPPSIVLTEHCWVKLQHLAIITIGIISYPPGFPVCSGRRLLEAAVLQVSENVYTHTLTQRCTLMYSWAQTQYNCNSKSQISHLDGYEYLSCHENMTVSAHEDTLSKTSNKMCRASLKLPFIFQCILGYTLWIE